MTGDCATCLQHEEQGAFINNTQIIQRLRYYIPNLPAAVVLGCSAYIAFLGIVPFFQPEFFDDGLDSGWLWVLQYAFAKNMQWGDEIIWHYGPLGFLFGRGFIPENMVVKTIIWVVLATTYLASCYTVIMRSGARTKPHLVALPVLMFIGSFTHEAVFFSFPILFLTYVFFMRSSQSKTLLFILAGVMGATALVKISYFVLSLSILLMVEVFRCAHLKSRPQYLLCFVLAFISGWLVAGQHLANIPGYLLGAAELSRGFAESMHHNEKWGFGYPIFLVGVFILWASALCVWVPQFGKEAWLPALGFAAVFFIASKVGFIHENNHHILQASAVFILVALLTRDLFWEDLSKNKQSFFMAYCMGIGILAAVFLSSDDVKKEWDAALKVPDSGVSLSMKSIGTQENNFNKAIAHIRKENPLPKVKGSVDIYAAAQSVLLAHGMDYNPRPVFQSYHAYTPYLAEKNRAHLLGNNAPDHIFFLTNEFFKRYPAVEDAVSWPEILTRYTPQKIYGKFLHLTKREKPKSYALKPIQQMQARWGEEVKVPELKKPALLWMKVRVKPSLLHRAITTLYRGARIQMQVTFADGKTKRFLLIPGTLEQGFLLSPFTESPQEFKALYAGETAPASRQVQSISLEHSGLDLISRHLFNPEIDVTFERVVITP